MRSQALVALLRRAGASRCYQHVAAVTTAAGWHSLYSQPVCLESKHAGSVWHRQWPQQQPWQSSRGISDTRDQQQTQELQGFLDSLQATKLRDSLENEALVKPFMSNAELISFIKAQGAADTDADAQQRADALVRAGLVLRFNGIVYLRPQEVAQLVTRTLPTDPQLSRASLAAVEEQLSHLDQQYRQLHEHAQRWPRFWLRAGCAAVATQLGVFYWLTYYELSWDVMEPVAYILSLTYTLLAYIYFLSTRGSYFDLQPFQEYWTERQLEKKMAEKGFDLEQYKHLLRARECHQRYLSLGKPKQD